jgi:hypothetical protein
MSKHTPGPWRHSYDRGYFVEPLGRDQIGRVCTIQAPRNSETGLADARLIAAAPELLDALVSLGGTCFCDVGVGDPRMSDHSVPCKKARAAIAKATGPGGAE